MNYYYTIVIGSFELLFIYIILYKTILDRSTVHTCVVIHV